MLSFSVPEGTLKPCPFCGNRRIEVLPQEKGAWTVRCPVCGCNKFVITKFKSQVYEAWNKRLLPDSKNPNKEDISGLPEG